MNSYERDVLVTILTKSLESSETERESSYELLNHLKAEDVIGANNFMNVSLSPFYSVVCLMIDIFLVLIIGFQRTD